MVKNLSIYDLVRKNIRDLIPYASARDEYSGSASVFLDANENPHNFPLNRYPDPKQTRLKNAIATLKGLEVENIFLGNGSDEGIDLLFRVFCEPGVDKVITVDPTYGMYSVCAQINNVATKSVLLQEDFSLDPGEVLKSVDLSTKIIFLCSPNNPSSNSYDREAMVRIIDSARTSIVVVDEAYIDFSKEKSMLSLIPEKKNLVVLQTLSKAWGLAGIRLGMAFAHPELISYLSMVKYPYNLNSLSISEAETALQDLQKRDQWVKSILNEREKLSDRLNTFSFVDVVFPSDANFLLVRMSDPRNVYEYLMERGIIVRDRSTVSLCEGCLRVTVGTEEENQLLCDALDWYENNGVK